ncbi:MAG: hypothetical protein KDE14_01365 [Rhodobacteraceae bacterium]|nr:hypothetical protein [Paracoccaceae bacterium]
MHLPDPRVLLHHAEFSIRNREMYASPAPGADMQLNDTLAQVTRVSPGDKLRLGPFEIVLEENRDGEHVVLTAELIQPLGDELENLLSRSKVNVGRVGLSMRSWAWIGALVAAVAMFVVPWIASLYFNPSPLLMVLNTRDQRVAAAPTTWWSTGGISSAHKFFGQSCSSCHATPFVPVQDETCVVCHSGIQHHTDPAVFTKASFEGQACQSCHKEHQGNSTVARSDQKFCVDCHADIKDYSGDTRLRNVTDFGNDHPDFRPTVLVDAALQITERSKTMSGPELPREDASLKFPHDKHLRSEVKHPERGNISLECIDCHEVDAGGAYMLPLSFDRHCHQCHSLKFDVYIPDREMIHGTPETMFKQIRDVYDAVALRGGYEEPESPALVRRRPGTPLTPEEKAVVLDWSREKAEQTIKGRFGRGLCEGCHQVFDTPLSGGSTGGGWSVEPVSPTHRWFPAAFFSHRSHGDVECGTCHNARASTEAQDVIMPNAAMCQSCHGGESAKSRVPSTCVTCHSFHREGLPLMGPKRPQIFGSAKPIEPQSVVR